MFLAGTPTPSFVNASATANTFGSSGGLLAVLVVVGLYSIAALLLAQVVGPWLARSGLLAALSDRVLRSVEFAAKGVAASAVLAAIGLPVALLATAEASTQFAVARWAGIAIAGYATLVVVGWLADRSVTAFIEAHPEYEAWGDIFDASDGDESPEPAAADD